MPQRNWLITGVSSGFGRIMTEQLLARGDRIAGTVRDLSVMNDLEAEYGDRLWLAGLDLSEIASIRGVVDRAWAALDRIDVVVSNAGYGLMGAAEELTDEHAPKTRPAPRRLTIHVKMASRCSADALRKASGIPRRIANPKRTPRRSDAGK
jgi:NAD(P)-dependent dehydrogenase (short-subunit alcohol dehydrogenase family)